MPKIKIIVARDDNIASRHVASIIKRQLHRKPNTNFLLPTGSTPITLYKLLAERVANRSLSFKHATSFNLDEYLGLSATHSQSYHSFMEQHLFSRIDLPKRNHHLPPSKPADSVKACKVYENRILSTGIDVAILGIGTNGHLGFNEPNTSFDSTTHIADLSASTRSANARFFSSPAQVPRQAITVGLDTIMSARHIILIAFGANKAKAIKQALEGKQSTRHPASILQSHPHVTVVLDQTAAASLKQSDFSPPKIGAVKLYSDFNLPRGRTIVFFSPHPDDAPISSGALLAALASKNEVHEFIVTTGHRAVSNGTNKQAHIKKREREAMAEAKILGTHLHFCRSRFYDNHKAIDETDLKQTRAKLHALEPDIAFMPHSLDPHATHISTRKLALAALPHGVTVWNYETPWGLFSHHKFNAAFEFDQALLDQKIDAIRQHQSQIKRTSFDTAAASIARFRSITIGEQFFSDLGRTPLNTLPYLELFYITRW